MPRELNPIRLACRLEVLPGDRVADRIRAARDFGFSGITLPGRFKEDWMQPMRDGIQEGTLPLIAISLGFEHSLISRHPSDRTACRDSLLRMFDLCSDLSVPRFNMPPCLIQDNPHRIQDCGTFASVRERLDQLLLDELPPLADAARARGIELLLEPVNRYESDYLNSIEHAADLCRRLNHPHVGFTADFFHMQLEELRPPDAIRRAASGGFLRHVHVAENTRVEPGPGSLDLAAGFRALKDSGYTGWIELECRHLSGPAGQVLPRSVEHLQQTWHSS